MNRWRRIGTAWVRECSCNAGAQVEAARTVLMLIKECGYPTHQAALARLLEVHYSTDPHKPAAMVLRKR